MHRTRPISYFAAGASAVLLALTAGCGSSPSATESDAKASASASKGGDSSAAATSLTKSDIFAKLTAAQKQAGSYTFTMTIEAAGKTGTGTGEADASSSPPAVHVALDQGGQSIETITAGGIVYFKAPFLGTSKWIKIDPRSKSGLGALVGQSGSGDPSAQLAAIADAAKVVKGGTTALDGVSTTEYDVTVPGSVVAKKAKVPAAQASVFPKEIVYKLFVDDDNLLRRLSTDVAVSGQSSKVQIDFADYGKPVSIKAPPAAQTTSDFKLPGA